MGEAYDRENRYDDLANRAMRGQEQQAVDAYGGAWTDTNKAGLPHLTGNEQRPVRIGNPWAETFDAAATSLFGQMRSYNPVMGRR